MRSTLQKFPQSQWSHMEIPPAPTIDGGACGRCLFGCVTSSFTRKRPFRPSRKAMLNQAHITLLLPEALPANLRRGRILLQRRNRRALGCGLEINAGRLPHLPLRKKTTHKKQDTGASSPQRRRPCSSTTAGPGRGRRITNVLPSSREGSSSCSRSSGPDRRWRSSTCEK